jgi:CheY-like chemotaxis protein
LTGSPTEGDALVAAGLRRLTAEPERQVAYREGETRLADAARLALYGAVTASVELVSAGPGPTSRPASPDAAGDGPGLTLLQRQLLLLTSLEEVGVHDAAAIVGVEPAEVDSLLDDARLRLRDAAAADVLIIEDEPIIAMDIEELVTNCGHRVVGIASTETEAVDLARRTRPGLILADINLGVGGDGTNAVARILRHHEAPVIFVTAYPERLLTGEAVEPAFVITKPFDPVTLAIATYQAVTGGVRLD